MKGGESGQMKEFGCWPGCGIPKRECNARQTHQHVIPAQPRPVANQPGRDEDAHPKGQQEQRGDEGKSGRGALKDGKGVQRVVESVGDPADLPGAEIGSPALLVKVSKDTAK